MARQHTCRDFGWRWLRTTCWAIGITLLAIELGVGTEYLLTGLRMVEPELFAWWPAFSMMAWELADKMAWHAATVNSTVRMMPLSALPFAFIAAAIGLGRRIS